MARTPCCEKTGLKKGPWTPEEDKKLIDFIQKNGHGSWRALPMKAGLLRCGKSCRLRWTNYLRPDIKRGEFSFEEDNAIISLHSALGNKWSTIAARLPGRTDNEIKNYWNTHLKKRLTSIGIDPMTHKTIAKVPHTGSNEVSFFNLLNPATEWEPSRFGTSMATEDRVAPYQILGDHLSRDHDAARATFGHGDCVGLVACSSQGYLLSPVIEETLEIKRASEREGRGGYFGNMLEGYGGAMNPTAIFKYE